MNPLNHPSLDVNENMHSNLPYLLKILSQSQYYHSSFSYKTDILIVSPVTAASPAAPAAPAAAPVAPAYDYVVLY